MPNIRLPPRPPQKNFFSPPSPPPPAPRTQHPPPGPAAEVAQSIGPRLARAALAAKVDGKLVDLSTTIEKDADLAIVTPKSPEGVDILRHSTSHLMAQAVQE